MDSCGKQKRRSKLTGLDGKRGHTDGSKWREVKWRIHGGGLQRCDLLHVRLAA